VVGTTNTYCLGVADGAARPTFAADRTCWRARGAADEDAVGGAGIAPGWAAPPGCEHSVRYHFGGIDYSLTANYHSHFHLYRNKVYRPSLVQALLLAEVNSATETKEKTFIAWHFCNRFVYNLLPEAEFRLSRPDPNSMNQDCS